MADKEILKAWKASPENPYHETGKPKRDTKAMRLKNLLTKHGFTVQSCKNAYHYAYSTVVNRNGALLDINTEDDETYTGNRYPGFTPPEQPLHYWVLDANGRRQHHGGIGTVEELEALHRFQKA